MHVFAMLLVLIDQAPCTNHVLDKISDCISILNIVRYQSMKFQWQLPFIIIYCVISIGVTKH